MLYIRQSKGRKAMTMKMVKVSKVVKKTRRAILCLVPLLFSSVSVFAVPITEDFETAPAFVFDGTELSGMRFTTLNALLSLVVNNGGNHELLVAGPGTPGSGQLQLDFLGGPVASVSAIISNAENDAPVVIDAYDADDNLLETSDSGGNPGPDTLFISRAIADIEYVRIHDSGNDFEVDNITYNFLPSLDPSLVPEPGSVVLFFLGVAGMLTLRNRS